MHDNIELIVIDDVVNATEPTTSHILLNTTARNMENNFKRQINRKRGNQLNNSSISTAQSTNVSNLYFLALKFFNFNFQLH